MKTIKGDLILKENTTFNESIEVEGDIKGWFDLKVKGDINAGDIDVRNIDVWDINAWDINVGNIDVWDINARDINAAGNINARNIDAGDINAGDINAGDIDVRNIDARDIVCETRTKKSKNAKTICRVYVKNKSKLERKEQEKN